MLPLRTLECPQTVTLTITLKVCRQTAPLLRKIYCRGLKIKLFLLLGSSTTASVTGATDDTDTHVTPEYVPGCFEGPEKTMEVVFKPTSGPDDGLRSLSREQLDFLCTQAKCTILSSISNSYIDAYVLSESSLFIYKSRFIMKTCGTTTLLRCLSSLLQFADALGMELTWVGYSRKNLLFPSAQVTPLLFQLFFISFYCFHLLFVFPFQNKYNLLLCVIYTTQISRAPPSNITYNF